MSSSATPKDIFKSCKNTELLSELASQKGIELPEDCDRKDIIDQLAKVTTAAGLQLLLSKILKLKTLKLLAGDKIDYGGKKSLPRGTLVTKIKDLMGTKPKKFFDSMSSTDLVEILKDMAIEIPESKKEYSNSILKGADVLGLENVLSSLGAQKLKQFATSSGLTVETSSLDILLDSITHQHNYESQKKEGSPKNRPAIDNKIDEEELVDNYLRPELVKYCDENDILTTGTKADLAKRIVNFLHEKPFPKKSEYLELQRLKKRAAEAKAKARAEERSEEKSEEKSEEQSEEKSEEKSDSDRKPRKTKRSKKSKQEDEEREEPKNKKKAKTTATTTKQKKNEKNKRNEEEEKEGEEREEEEEEEKKKQLTTNKKKSKQ